MAILSYKFEDTGEAGFHFSKIDLERLNLLVGATGSGKTRLLNTIFNLALFAVGKRPLMGSSKWDLEIEQQGKRYRWEIESEVVKKGECVVKQETLSLVRNEGNIEIVRREGSDFYYRGKKLPKLSRTQPSIFLLKEENDLDVLNESFGTVLRRYFWGDQLSNAVKYGFLANEFVEKVEEEKDIRTLFGVEIDVSAKLWVLSKAFPKIYSIIYENFLKVFPFVQSVKLADLKEVSSKGSLPGIVAAFSIKEKSVGDWIYLDQLSSGMQKVLLILTDICTLPVGATYLIDEYENSLGVNAIDFFPNFLDEFETNAQIIMTSHHPYIINNIDPKYWFVFHRKGSEVKIKYGKEYAEKLGKSRQKYFVQLVNDPFYTEGVE